jgi:hypothetical protein
VSKPTENDSDFPRRHTKLNSLHEDSDTHGSKIRPLVTNFRLARIVLMNGSIHFLWVRAYHLDRLQGDQRCERSCGPL